MSALARMAELGIELPDVAAPAGSYVPAVRTGNLVYTSGQVDFQLHTAETHVDACGLKILIDTVGIGNGRDRQHHAKHGDEEP